MAEYENQHSVALFYLRRFTQVAGDRVLWQYSRLDPFNPRTVSPRKATAESFLHSVPTPDGEWDHCIERDLSQVEDSSAPAINRLLSTGRISDKDRLIIGKYIGVQYLRTRGLRSHSDRNAQAAATPEFTIAFIEADRRFLESRFGKKEVDDYIEQVRARGFGMKLASKWHLANIIDRGERFGRRVAAMGWTLCRSSNPYFFVTSDNPAFVRRPDFVDSPTVVGINRGDLGAELGIPLSSRIFLLASWKRPGSLQTIRAPKMRVRELNRRTVLSAYEHVYCREKSDDIMRLVDEHRNYQFKYGFHAAAEPGLSL